MNRRFLGFAAGLAIAALTSAAPRSGGKLVLPFIEDDYSKALAQAKARHVPIFIEAWAPW